MPYEPLAYLDDDEAGTVCELAEAVMASLEARPIPIESGLFVDGDVIDGDLETAVREIVARTLILKGALTPPP